MTWVVVAVPPLAMPSALPRVRAPIVASCENRFVLDAVVEKKFVVVALVSAAEFAERTPKVAEVEYKFVLVAVPK